MRNMTLLTLLCLTLICSAPMAFGDSYPPLRWLGLNVLQVTPGTWAGTGIVADGQGDVLLFARNYQTREYKLSYYNPASAWADKTVPAGVRPTTIGMTDYGAFVHTDDNGSTPARLWVLPDGGTMTQLFVGNPNAGGGPGSESMNDSGAIVFVNAADNHYSTPKDFYLWTPQDGLVSLPRLPNDPLYYGSTAPKVDPQNRPVLVKSDGIWRYEQGNWNQIAPAPNEGYVGTGQYLQFASNGDFVLPVNVYQGTQQVPRWLRWDVDEQSYVTVYQTPLLQGGLTPNLSSAKLGPDNTLTFYVDAYYGSTKAEALTQISPDGDVTVIEQTWPGEAKPAFNRFAFNEAGEVLADFKDPATGQWGFHLWSNGYWKDILPQETRNKVTSFTLDEDGNCYFAFLSGTTGQIDIAMVVPEPASLTLLALGGLLVLRRSHHG